MKLICSLLLLLSLAVHAQIGPAPPYFGSSSGSGAVISGFDSFESYSAGTSLNGLASGTTTATNLGGATLTSSYFDQTSPYQWSNNMVALSVGTPSAYTCSVLETYMAGLVTDGVWSNVTMLCMFTTDSIAIATSPLLIDGAPGNVTPLFFGNSQTTFVNNGPFVAADLTVNGFTGDGTSKDFTSTLNPQALLTATDAGMAWYSYKTNSAVDGIDVGCWDTGTAFWGSSEFEDGSHFLSYLIHTGTGAVRANSPGNGFYATVRVSASEHDCYFANSTTPFNNFASNATASSGNPPSDLLYIFRIGNVSGFFSNGTISFVCIFHGKFMTSTITQGLYNRTQTARVSIGGGYR